MSGVVGIKLRYNSVKFVFERGDKVTRLHLLQFLDMLDTRQGKDLILQVLASQMPSGGFPCKFDEKTEGVRETCRNVLLLLKCGVPHDRLNIQAAVNHLLSHQREDGGWSENPALTIPENVVELSTAQSVTWVSSDIVELLRSVGLGRSKPCTRALKWLRSMQNQEGGWPMFKKDRFGSDPDSTAQTLFMMREIYGEDDTVWLKGVKFYEKCLDGVAKDAERGYYIAPDGKKREDDIYHLTHLLLSSLVDPKRRIEAGYDLNDERVKQIVQAIFETQREDGGWRPFFSEESSPTYTLLTLKLLAWLGAVNLDDLKKQAATYAQS